MTPLCKTLKEEMLAWRKTCAKTNPGINKDAITKDWQERISKYKMNEAENERDK